MKKLFLAICFISLACPAAAGLQEINNPAVISSLPRQPRQDKVPVHDVSEDELSRFLEDRLSKTVIIKKEEFKEENISVIPWENGQKQINEKNKSTFEKIYENALARVKHSQTSNTSSVQKSTTLPSAFTDTDKDVPHINIALPPYNEKSSIAAVEHIPYLYDRIEILPDGTALFNEKIVFLDEHKKSTRPLIKKLPRYVYNRRGHKKEINYTLADVLINEQPTAYKITEKADEIWLEPPIDLELEAGIYQYEFRFMANRLIDAYDNIQEFYWNASGAGWDYIIARMGASIHLPAQARVLAAFALNGYGRDLRYSDIRAQALEKNVLSFNTKIPVFLKESLHLSAILENNGAITTPLAKKISGFTDDNLDWFITLAALLFITGAYLLSWRSIRRNKTKPAASLKKTPQTMRYLTQNGYDSKNLIVFLLDLYKKNIIDIQQAGEVVLLVKKTDQIKSLNSAEKKALHALFGTQNAVFKVCRQNILNLKRAARSLRRALQKKLAVYIIKTNGVYLLFSLGMLLSAAAAAIIAKSGSMFGFLWLAAFCLCATGIGLLLFMKCRSIWLSSLLKIGGFSLCVLLWILSSSLISPIAALFFVLSALVIAFFTHCFARNRGLLKNILNDINAQKDYLKKNKETVMMGREIINMQPMILALDMEKDFIDNNEFNKLGAAEQIHRIIRSS